MSRELVLPPDFADYAWEFEAKGYFFDAAVRVDGLLISVSFFDPCACNRKSPTISSRDVISQSSACWLLRESLSGTCSWLYPKHHQNSLTKSVGAGSLLD